MIFKYAIKPAKVQDPDNKDIRKVLQGPSPGQAGGRFFNRQITDDRKSPDGEEAKGRRPGTQHALKRSLITEHRILNTDY